jgi:flagellar basal-body rod protein FlgB
MADTLDTSLQFHVEALNLRALRQQVLASNIANADTPGYKARDIDFRKSLDDALAGRVSTTELARSAAAHLASGPAGAAAGPLQYRAVLQPTMDGNTVDMDVERAHFAENAIHFEANLMFINSQLKAMLAAIQG